MNLTWWSEHPSELPLLLLTAVATHLLMSFSQTLMHYRLGHRRLGGMFFRNHIQFHHVHYSKDHLASLTYIKNDGDGNNTPFFLKAYPSASGDPICGGVAAPAGVERKANIVRSRDHHDRFSPLADRVPEPLSG